MPSERSRRTILEARSLFLGRREGSPFFLAFLPAGGAFMPGKDRHPAERLTADAGHLVIELPVPDHLPRFHLIFSLNHSTRSDTSSTRSQAFSATSSWDQPSADKDKASRSRGESSARESVNSFSRAARSGDAAGSVRSCPKARRTG